jgi:hypothetical protein
MLGCAPATPFDFQRTLRARAWTWRQVQGNLLWKLFLGSISRMMETEGGELLTRWKEALQGT